MNTHTVVLCILLSLYHLVFATPPKQHPLDSSPHPSSILAVRSALISAEIIPTVVDDFLPTLLLNVTWRHDTKSRAGPTANLGNTLDPSALQHAPALRLSASATSSAPSGIRYTVAMTDPDAPSRDDPRWSEVCHWIATGFRLPDAAAAADAVAQVKDVVPYKPPGPPPATGKHRYALLVLAPRNSTTKKLHLSAPKERRRWGYEDEGRRVGLRRWMVENQLVVVGANFFYAQNEKQ